MVVWIARKGDMRSKPPVKVRVSGVVERREDVRGRMGRVTRGTIVRKRVKRGSIRLILDEIIARFFFWSLYVFGRVSGVGGV